MSGGFLYTMPPHRRAIIGFLAGATWVLPFYQGLWTTCAQAGLNLQPYPSGGIPLLLLLCAAGGGIWCHPRQPRPPPARPVLVPWNAPRHGDFRAALVRPRSTHRGTRRRRVASGSDAANPNHSRCVGLRPWSDSPSDFVPVHRGITGIPSAKLTPRPWIVSYKTTHGAS